MTAYESSVPTINVGGNFTQGAISGQSAIGSNISQVLYKDCIFNFPDGSTKKGYSWIYTQGTRPTIDPKRIFGREKDLENLDNSLKEKSTLVITGLRGTGKSTLASMFVDRMVENGKFAGIYWRKIDENTEISDIIGGFFTVIGKSVENLERYKITDQINLFFQEFNEASYLLVLDNFEILLDPHTNKPLVSKVGFSDLIEKASENCIKSKILFISWDSLASERGIRPFSYKIVGLDTSAGILLLRREGLNEPEDELKKAIELSGGHPLALILLAQLVLEGVDTLSTLLNDDSLWIGKDGEVAENILNKVYNERLSEDERKLLQYASIFRQAVTVKAICAIANNSEWSESKVKSVALSLTRKSLLQKDEQNYWEECLIRKYATTRLSEKTECHKLACKFYRSCLLPAKPKKKEDIQSVIEAHYHACKAGEYDLAANIIWEPKLHYLLDLWGNPRKLIEIGGKLLPKDHFKDEPILKNKHRHIDVLGIMGVEHKVLGEPRKAIEYYNQALKISREIGDKQREANLLVNLGIAYKDLGKPIKAIECYDQAIKILRDIGDKQGERNPLVNLGVAYKDLGEPRKAIEYYSQALKISREINDRRLEGATLGNLGIAYKVLGETKKAIKYYKQALKISRETEDKIGERNVLINFGIAYKDIGKSVKAIEYFNLGLKISKEMGDSRGEQSYLKNLGLVYSYLRDPMKEIECYEQALKISREIGDRYSEGANLISLGLAYSNLSKQKIAIEYYEQALKISREVEYKRGEGAALVNLGLAYSDLNETKKAIEFLKESLAIGKLTGDPEIISLCEQELKEIEKSNEWLS